MIDALDRMRVLRRDSYRCRAQEPRKAICGTFASRVGPRSSDGLIVALCPAHAPEGGSQ